MEIKKPAYHFIVYMRVFCALMVAYNHLGAMRHPEWLATRFFQFAFNVPLALIQNFGALAVCIFFLISGFLSGKYPAQGEASLKSAGVYLYRKVKRIVVPLLAAMLIGYGSLQLYTLLTGRPNCLWEFSNRDWLRSALLLNHIQGKPDYINGALWYLVPLLGFYLLYAAASLAAGKLPPWGRILCFDVLYGLLTGALAWNGMPSLLPYVMIPLFGTLLWQLFRGQIGVKIWGALSLICWLLMTVSFYLLQNNHYSGEPYLASFGAGWLIFILLLLADDRVPAPGRTWLYLGSISYEFYLIHCVIGGFSMWLLESIHVPVTVAVLLSILVSGAWAAFTHAAVETVPRWVRKK